jgi:hypothetical protein
LPSLPHSSALAGSLVYVVLVIVLSSSMSVCDVAA